MQKLILKNKLRVLVEEKPSKSVAISILIKTGSINEGKKILGISHLIEHLLFEGTKTRTQKQIAEEIEKIGGELNALTSTQYTIFYAIVLKKHFEKALSVLADIIQNPTFEGKAINKEKKIILEEIKLITDQPRFHQWILFQKNLFKVHPIKNPIYGTEETIKSITREDILDYYKKYYIPNNIIVTIVGNAKDPKNTIENHFKNFIPKELETKTFKDVPNKKFRKVEKRKTLHTYIVLGYKTVPRTNKDSYALDLLKIILGYGQSSKLFSSIRNKYGLAYEIAAQHEAGIDYGFFAVNLSTESKNKEKAIDIILKEFKDLQKLTDKELKEAKEQIEGLFELQNEDNYKLSETLSYYEMIEDAELAKKYISNIKKISLKEIKKIAKKYLNEKYTVTMIEGI